VLQPSGSLATDPTPGRDSSDAPMPIRDSLAPRAHDSTAALDKSEQPSGGSSHARPPPLEKPLRHRMLAGHDADWTKRPPVMKPRRFLLV
jgi:hypothetical protein